MALAVALAVGLVFLLVRDHRARPTSKLQEVRFDGSLWELDRVADAPTGDATAEMTNWVGR
jgi:hypothetical protein